jgi:ABC-type transport system substrate-binding protein
MPWRSPFPALLAAGALFAAACSGSDAQDTTTTTVEAPQTAATTTITSATTTTTTLPERFEGQLAGLTVLDENRFTVELVEPDPEFPLRLAIPAFLALPDAALESPAAQNEKPIGNGPFMMEGAWEHNVRIRAVRNPDYRGPDLAKLESLEWVIFPNIENAHLEFLAGELDILVHFGTELVSEMPPSVGTYQRFEAPSLWYLGIPTYLEQYTKEIRQALSMAIDRAVLNEEVSEDGGIPAYSVVPTAVGGREFVCDNWEHDPERARELWEVSGGLDNITFWVPGGTPFPIAEEIVAMWSAALGVEPSIVIYEGPEEFSEYVTALDTAQSTGVFMLGWFADYPSPLGYLEPPYTSYNTPPAGANTTFFESSDFDAAIAAGKAEVAATGLLQDGLADYYEAEDLLCEEVRAIPFMFPFSDLFYAANVSDVLMDPYGYLGYTLIETERGAVSTDLEEPESLFSTNTYESGGGDAVLLALNTGLVKYDVRTSQLFNAHSRSITSDDGGVTWTVVLNPGWTFHDGTPNDATSYVKAWSFGADAANGQATNGLYRNIVGYDELNPDTGED